MSGVERDDIAAIIDPDAFRPSLLADEFERNGVGISPKIAARLKADRVIEALTTPSQGLDAATVERCVDVAFVAAMKAGRGLEQAQQDAAFVRRALATDPHQHGGKGA